MTTHIEQELGLAPTTHRIKRWFRKLVPEDRRSLDPLTVNYEAWRAVRQNVREWPHYLEAPNCIEVLVSPEDWDDYWGIDYARKEAGVSSYVRSKAANKGYWMAGDPQVFVEVDDAIGMGDVEIHCQFIEPLNQEEPSPLSNTATRLGEEAGASAIPPFLMQNDRAEQTTRLTTEDLRKAQEAAQAAQEAGTVPAAEEPVGEEREAPTLRFIDSERDNIAFLVDGESFRLEVHSGDCIGAVRWGEEVPPEVNVRLDAEGFPYVDVMQCTIAVLEGRWTVTNHAPRGTRLTKRDGRRFMLGEPVPCSIEDGDVLWLGPRRPLTFEVGLEH
ncbi:MAG: DUF3662 domain-containing protein [Coriobacteriales bacterium]|nr:DUF3662 domain-containing protein [Coriobacteriales bacterium]